MDLNTYQGDFGQQIGTLISDLRSRIERLENEDRLTRTHPVSGSKDFEGTVVRTPSGVPVFVVSQSGGLESPPSVGTYIETNEDFFREWHFPGTYADAAQIYVNLQYEGVTLDWEVKLQLKSVKVNRRDSSFTIIHESAPVIFSPTSGNMDTESATSGWLSEGTLLWRHGQEISTEDDLVLQLFVTLTNNTGAPMTLSSLKVSGEDPSLPAALVRGAEMHPDFNPDARYIREIVF